MKLSVNLYSNICIAYNSNAKINNTIICEGLIRSPSRTSMIYAYAYNMCDLIVGFLKHLSKTEVVDICFCGFLKNFESLYHN